MRRPQLLVLVTAAALVTACGPEADLDLDLRAVNITVPRLVTPAIEIVPPGPAPLPLPPVRPPLVLPEPPVAPPAPSAAPVLDPCPKAGSLDVPAKPASVLVPTPPAADSFVQLGAGAFSSSTASTPLAGPVQVTVKRLGTGTTIGGQPAEGWEVQRVDPLRKSRQVERYQLVGAGGASAAAPGIYLVGLAWEDAQRGSLSLNAADLGIQVLPVPVSLADPQRLQYVGTATDPDTLTTLQVVRNVTGRKRVDTCGKLVDTFTVEMSGVLTAPGREYQLTWTQQLATAYGAANVAETLTLVASTEGSTWTRSLLSTGVPKEAR